LDQLGELVVYYSFSSNERISSSAEELLTYVAKNAHASSIPPKMFDFIRKAPSSLYESRKDYFNGEAKEEEAVYFHQIVKSIYHNAFKMVNEETLKTLLLVASSPSTSVNQLKSKEEEKQGQQHFPPARSTVRKALGMEKPDKPLPATPGSVRRLVIGKEVEDIEEEESDEDDQEEEETDEEEERLEEESDDDEEQDDEDGDDDGSSDDEKNKPKETPPVKPLPQKPPSKPLPPPKP
jgi:hypothetical protein